MKNIQEDLNSTTTVSNSQEKDTTSITLNKKDLGDSSVRANIDKIKGNKSINVVDEESRPSKYKYLSNIKDSKSGDISKPFTLNGKRYQMIRAISPLKEKVSAVYCLDEVDEGGENIIHPVDYFEKNIAKKQIEEIKKPDNSKSIKSDSDKDIALLKGFKYFLVNKKTKKFRKFKTAAELAKANMGEDEVFMSQKELRNFINETLFGKTRKNATSPNIVNEGRVFKKNEIDSIILNGSLSNVKKKPIIEGIQVVDGRTKQQLLDKRLNKIKEIRDRAEGTREERVKRYNELFKETGNETIALKKLQSEINAKANIEIAKLPELPETENEIINKKGESDFNKIIKDLGFKTNNYKWGEGRPIDDDMGDMLLSKDKESVIFIKPNESEVYDETDDNTDIVINGIKIELISTKESSRGTGKAKNLIQKVVDWADKNGTDLYLDIAPQDKSTTEDGLKKLYQSFGFEFNGIHGKRESKQLKNERITRKTSSAFPTNEEAPKGQKNKIGISEDIDGIGQGDAEDSSTLLNNGRREPKTKELKQPEYTSFKGVDGNKVVDEKGEPLTVYRSQENDRDQGNERQSKHFGIYFSQNKESTKIYGDKTKEYNVNLQNPKVLKDNEWNLSVIPEYLFNKLKSDGYDGAIWLRKGEMYEIVAFDKSQIKELPNEITMTGINEVENTSSFLNSDIEKQIIDIIKQNKGFVKRDLFTPQLYRYAMSDDPELHKELIKTIYQQSIDPASRDNFIKLVGKNIVELALKLKGMNRLGENKENNKTYSAFAQEEIEKEIENTKTAIEIAKTDEDFQFEGVSIKELIADLKTLNESPIKYFEKRIIELTNDLYNSRIKKSSEDEKQILNLIDEYQKVYDDLSDNKEKIGDVM